MEEKKDPIQKTVLLNKNDEAILVCDNCGTFQKIEASRYRTGEGTRIPVECQKCGRLYSVFVQLRKNFRKKVSLPGTYTLIRPSWGGQANMHVEDLSKTGLSFRTDGPARLAVGDEIKLKFVLDNAHKSTVEKHAVVKRVRKDFVGVLFDKTIDEREPELAFYLM